MELHGILTIKEIKKTHSPRPVGGVESGQFHICLRIDWQEQLGSKTDRTTQGFSMRKENFKTYGCQNL